jgi:hypothetical protein
VDFLARSSFLLTIDFFFLSRKRFLKFSVQLRGVGMVGLIDCMMAISNASRSYVEGSGSLPRK